MILDFFLSHFSKKERFGLTLLTLLANLAYYLCSAIVTAGTRVSQHLCRRAVRAGNPFVRRLRMGDLVLLPA